MYSLHCSIVVASTNSSEFSFVVGVCCGNIRTWLYAFSYASCSSSSVGRLYASRLLIRLCTNILSIQFGFIPPIAKHVWSFFLMLCDDRCFSPVLRNADCIIVPKSPLVTLVGWLLLYFMNSGVSGVIVSGFSFRVPVWRYLMYVCIAVIDSFAKYVLMVSPVFCRSAWYGIIFVFGLFRNNPQFRFFMSEMPKPVSFIVRITAVSLGLFGFASKTLSMCSLVARLTPKALPFG